MSTPALLVSVRNFTEARAAVEGGGDRLDVKEPLRGPLGMADAETISQIAAYSLCPADGKAPLPCSVALGELDDWGDIEHRAGDDWSSFPAGVTDIKLGPANLHTPRCWLDAWQRSLQRFPPAAQGAVRRVAVAYADWKSADALPPERILQSAIEVGSGAFLIDTFRKDGGCLLDAIDARELERLSAAAHQSGLTLALAGSIGLEHLPRLVDARPDVIAVRGAACANRCRTAAISSALVRRLKTALVELFAANASKHDA